MKALLTVVAIAAFALPALAQWPQFRGPNGSGVGDTTGLPERIGKNENVLWRIDVPPGKSSPIIVGERLFLTGHDEETLVLLCFDRNKGTLLWRREMEKERVEGRNALNDPASPTPVADEDSVYAFFPELGLIAFDFEGRERWRRPLGPFLTEHGLSVSPVIADRWIVLQIDQLRDSHMLGVRREDGQVAWKQARTDAGGAYSTPAVYRPDAGTARVVTAGPFELAAYSADSGEKIWWADELGYQPKSLPVLDGDRVYVSVVGIGDTVPSFASVDTDGDGRISATEFPFLENPGTITLADQDGDGAITESDWHFITVLSRPGRGGLIAFQMNGRGNVTGKNVAWSTKRAIPNVTSPLVYRDVLYLVRNGGILSSLDPETGAVLKRGRLDGAIDAYYASPVAADGKIVTISETCLVSIVEAAAEWRILAVADLDDTCYASPALAGSTIYLRTSGTLYAFASSRD